MEWVSITLLTVELPAEAEQVSPNVILTSPARGVAAVILMDVILWPSRLLDLRVSFARLIIFWKVKLPAEPVFAAAIFVPVANDPEVASWVDGSFE